MPFKRWDLCYKPEKNDRTGFNIIKKALDSGKLSWFDKQLGGPISKKKIPEDIKAFAKLNAVEQSHLIASIFDPNGENVKYN